MKKLLIIVFNLFFFGSLIFAQEKPKSFQWDNSSMTELGISKEKQQKIQNMNDTLKKKIELVKEDKSYNKEEIKEKITELRKSSQKEIMSLLNDEEKIKLKELKEKIKASNN